MGPPRPAFVEQGASAQAPGLRADPTLSIHCSRTLMATGQFFGAESWAVDTQVGKAQVHTLSQRWRWVRKGGKTFTHAAVIYCAPAVCTWSFTKC